MQGMNVYRIVRLCSVLGLGVLAVVLGLLVETAEGGTAAPVVEPAAEVAAAPLANRVGTSRLCRLHPHHCETDVSQDTAKRWRRPDGVLVTGRSISVYGQLNNRENVYTWTNGARSFERWQYSGSDLYLMTFGDNIDVARGPNRLGGIRYPGVGGTSWMFATSRGQSFVPARSGGGSNGENGYFYVEDRQYWGPKGSQNRWDWCHGTKRGDPDNLMAGAPEAAVQACLNSPRVELVHQRSSWIGRLDNGELGNHVVCEVVIQASGNPYPNSTNPGDYVGWLWNGEIAWNSFYYPVDTDGDNLINPINGRWGTWCTNRDLQFYEAYNLGSSPKWRNGANGNEIP